MGERGFVSRFRDLARASPGELGIAALLAVFVLTGAIYVFARTSEPPPPPIKRAGAEAVSPTPTVQLVVHVAGLVAKPGVYELPDGSRVRDAVRAAGGARSGADLHSINLAARLTDGEKVTVPAKGAAAGPADRAETGGKVNLNTASEAELEDLPGVGPVLAGRIVEYRTKQGPFTSIEQLMDVDGIGPKKFESLKELVSV